MRIGSAFSGIGCLELGVQMAIPDAKVLWQIEIEEFPRLVLAKHFPNADRSVTDIRDADGIRNLAPIDLLVAGWPCTDISTAGRMEGLDGKHSGLWRDLCGLISQVRSDWILLENVDAIRSIQNGFVLGCVAADLAALCYDFEWQYLSAAQVGAPHKRARWFCLAWRNDLATKDVANANSQPNATNGGQRADPESQGVGWRDDKPRGHADARRQGSNDSTRQDQGAHLANAQRTGLQGQRASGTAMHPEAYQDRQTSLTVTVDARQWQVEPSIRRVVDRSADRVHERHRKEALKALGNSVVPQCVYLVARRLLELATDLLVPCEDCGNRWCTMHHMHWVDCACPAWSEDDHANL